MRSPQELQAKLAECESHVTPMYNAIGDRSAWEYWAGFANLLRWIVLEDGPKTDREMRVIRKRALAIKNWQLAAMYSWILQPPAHVIDEEGRARAQATANRTGKPQWIRAIASGTYYKSVKIWLRCELIEPQEPPVKRPNKKIQDDLRTALIRRSQAERRLG